MSSSKTNARAKTNANTNYSSEPVYITNDGERIPYTPKTITNAREAYAASMHVLFRHVAEFHVCIVKVFSEKYGIPEDDIMTTIHESTEFKKLSPEPALEEIFIKLPVEVEVDEPKNVASASVTATTSTATSCKKRIVKKKTEHEPIPSTSAATSAASDATVEKEPEPAVVPAVVPETVHERPKKKPAPKTSTKSSKQSDKLKTPEPITDSESNPEPEPKSLPNSVTEVAPEVVQVVQVKKESRPAAGTRIQQKLVFKKKE
jgi:hypothetical protein